VEEGYALYIQNQCQAIIAVGGGSPLDCAKIIGVKATNHNLSYEKMKRIYPITSPMPPFFAIPTTAGSGTESTIAAVISEPATHRKYAISSPLLMPSHVVLDPMLTLSLPNHITSTTGMDALTHAIEAYLGTIGTKYTDRQALKALKIIFNNLVSGYIDGSNVKVRAKLLYASNYAANAFTRALVGYVHSISHAISALYDVPHGLANAVILPYVLEYYGTSIYKKLARIAIYTEIGKAGQKEDVLAKLVIQRIKEMNETIGISTKIPQIRKEDIPTIVNKALKEANPLYPVPKIMDTRDCEKLLLKLCE
jgi:alcohol dehydrogenase class IV